jgi:muramoyltetrapeptide carboxypeptidase
MGLLRSGSVISVVATSGGTEEDWQESIDMLVEDFAKLDYSLSFASHCIKNGQDLFSANSDDKRVEFFIQAANDANTDLLWAFRGGYGAAKLLPELDKIDLHRIKQKSLVGFSDLTILHIYLHNKYNIKTFHAPVLAHMSRARAMPLAVKEEIFAVLSGAQKKVLFNLEVISNAKKYTYIDGITEGGNLELVRFSLGTPWEIKCAGKIIFLEDVNDKAYRYDRSFFQLVKSDGFEGAKAVVLGRFTCIDENPAMEQELIKNFAKYTDVPIFRSLEFGHIDNNRIIPLNSKANISITGGGATIEIDASL